MKVRIGVGKAILARLEWFETCGYHKVSASSEASRKQMMMNHVWGLGEAVPRPAASKAPATIIFFPVPSKLMESSINNPATSLLSSEEGAMSDFSNFCLSSPQFWSSSSGN